jgi:hypothetical protein
MRKPGDLGTEPGVEEKNRAVWATDVTAANRGVPHVRADHVRARAPACEGQRPTTARHIARSGGLPHARTRTVVRGLGQWQASTQCRLVVSRTMAVRMMGADIMMTSTSQNNLFL